MSINWLRFRNNKAVQIFIFLIFVLVCLGIYFLASFLNKIKDFDQSSKAANQAITVQGYLADSSSQDYSNPYNTNQFYLTNSVTAGTGISTSGSKIVPQITMYPLDTGSYEIAVIPFSQVTVQGYLSNGRILTQSISSDQGQVLGTSTKSGSAQQTTSYTVSGRYIDIGLSPTPVICQNAVGMVYQGLNTFSVLLNRLDNSTYAQTFTENYPGVTPGAFRFSTVDANNYKVLGEIPPNLHYICGYVPNQGSYRDPNVPVNVNGNISNIRYVWGRGTAPSPTPTPIQPTPTRTPTPTPTPAPESAPIGYHDQINCLNTTGWSCDGNKFSQALQVHFYADGPAGSGTFIGYTDANQTREQAVANACGGYANHGFNFTVPNSIKDGRIHAIYSYAIGIDSNGQPNGNNPLLGQSPKDVLCSSLPAPTPQQLQPPSQIEYDIVNIINSRRSALGLFPLTFNDNLHTAARNHSSDMAMRNYFSHTEPPPAPYGQTPSDRLHNVGYQFAWFGEVLARTNSPDQTADDFVNIYWGSPPHREILTTCNATNIGCGYAAGAENFGYFTCELGRTDPTPPVCNPTPSVTISPTPPPGVSCCRADPQHPDYIDRNYCPSDCAACYGNIMCGTNGYEYCRWSYRPDSGTCQLSNCGMCRE